MNTETTTVPNLPVIRHPKQHGVNGVYCGGHWVDIEDCESSSADSNCAACPSYSPENPCPRSKTRHDSFIKGYPNHYDVVIIGAGCIGGAIARELSRYKISVLVLEAADDVSQGATKGNSGIVHSGYDDKPGTLHAKFCWPGNQMFEQLDKELRFGYQKNGSLVLATNQNEIKVLEELLDRGIKNGVQHLRIINEKELRELEPNVHPNCIAALYSPSAGNVIPYEFAIALCENAADNGVEFRIRREVQSITKEAVCNNGDTGDRFRISCRYWEPMDYINVLNKKNRTRPNGIIYSLIITLAGLGGFIAMETSYRKETNPIMLIILSFITVLIHLFYYYQVHCDKASNQIVSINEPAENVIKRASPPVGSGGQQVQVEDMFTGGSGSWAATNGKTVNEEIVYAKYIVNAAGGASDKIARMIGDDSFVIKPRLGDYLLLNRNQGHLTSHTLFPCPDPVLGKGVLVQTTLWGNLILGPTARDTHIAEAKEMTNACIQEYILSKCKQLVPYFDPKETIHAFCGARAKSSRGDWIIEPSKMDPSFIHAAGIDSPGLAGSPAIALEIVRLLQNAGLCTPLNDSFNPYRAPIITPKRGMKGLKIGPIGKNDSHGPSDVYDQNRMDSNVVCKCEKVTEAEIVRALRRSLPIDSTQAIRKRTRAGMGHCQGDQDNYNCECRVKAIIARENRSTLEEVGGRPWPATSTLTKRWIGNEEKAQLASRMQTQ